MKAAYRLAFQLGLDVDTVLDWPYEKLLEHFIYLDLEHTTDWIQTGLICATMANLWQKKRFKPEDFMPQNRPKIPLTKEGVLGVFKTIATMKPK